MVAPSALPSYDLYCSYENTGLYVTNDYMNIGITEDQNWTNAAIAVVSLLRQWNKDASGCWVYDSRGPTDDGTILVGRLVLDYKNIDIKFDETTKYGYDGGQYTMFVKLKDQFDRVKKLPAFW